MAHQQVISNVLHFSPSLEDIEHGILRGNKAPPGKFLRPFNTRDSRYIHVLKEIDPRIHFALHCGAKSCPPFQYFPFQHIHFALQFASECFVRNDVTVDHTKKEITISKIFQWYGEDFANTQEKLMEYLLGFMCSQQQVEFSDLIKSNKYTVKYRKYMWVNFWRKT